MSPIFVRPVREQLEHDRLIRFLQAKYKRKYDALTNVGEERVAPVKIGVATFFPDLVLMEGKKLAGVVEVESGESVNNLEAMAQWVHFARSKVPFHLYVPVTGYDTARRLCEAHQTRVSEVWTYRPVADGFDLVRMSHDATATIPPRTAARPAAPQKPAPATQKSSATKSKKPAAKPVKSSARSGSKKDSKKSTSRPRKPVARHKR